MSDRACNKCLLDRMRREAKKEGKRLLLVPKALGDWKGGKDVFEVADGVPPVWRAWFAEIPKRCAC